ncbi:YdjY domain-containing protein [Desulfosarcina ovata]|uniref:Uncharacterized protein n=1 Tax=Desulfosarcina ovata subsp. ovata TaxID=2752305 RepID=A0A5K8A519_9BACT|nr:YdjY domain-containing protein [Desulfosarcina ovata]BBO87567.1 hypothetical protein DSCOOX_07470 [Desulfosarcina ovata subsp. ovata]
MRTSGPLFSIITTMILAVFMAVGYPFECVMASDGVKKDQVQQNAPKPAPGRDAPLWEKGKPLRMDQMPPIRKMGEGRLLIGNIVIDKHIPMITVRGEVNMDKGLVEYLACGYRGKLHESVLKIDAEPFYLNIALLLVGLEPGDRKLESQGEDSIPEGDPVEISVQWVDEAKKRHTRRAEDLIFNQQTGKSMQHTDWVYTGSKIVNGRFMAQIEHSIASTYHDPYALLDHRLPTGSDDRLYFVNEEIVPPKGTKVVMIIKPAGAEQK